MIIFGEYVNLKVSKKVDFGYYFEDKFGDEVLFFNSDVKNYDIKEGDKLEVFIYRDFKDRMILILKKLYIIVG